jgi:hypothetical protein
MASSLPDRPAFARDFPSDARLDALVRAFADGDYARVRRDAPKVAKTADRDDVRLAARTLVDRTRPDPLMVVLLVLPGLLLLTLSLYWWAHNGPG